MPAALVDNGRSCCFLIENGGGMRWKVMDAIRGSSGAEGEDLTMHPIHWLVERVQVESLVSLSGALPGGPEHDEVESTKAAEVFRLPGKEKAFGSREALRRLESVSFAREVLKTLDASLEPRSGL